MNLPREQVTAAAAAAARQIPHAQCTQFSFRFRSLSLPVHILPFFRGAAGCRVPYASSSKLSLSTTRRNTTNFHRPSTDKTSPEETFSKIAQNSRRKPFRQSIPCSRQYTQPPLTFPSSTSPTHFRDKVCVYLSGFAAPRRNDFLRACKASCLSTLS